MGKKDSNHQIIYRGQMLQRFTSDGCVFVQRQKECGGGFWLGRTFDDCSGLNLISMFHYLIVLHVYSLILGG